MPVGHLVSHRAPRVFCGVLLRLRAGEKARVKAGGGVPPPWGTVGLEAEEATGVPNSLGSPGW